ncbi:conserved protein of unknown function [Candidatus Filomicrobium marinum]|uniref:Spermatogenesis-associated protein 20-like TRX domain-containing protein n=1 Tax=Candidatus Filomicrobium marinum TaxID=1608628 RepID=A0A0D6JD32_9HYPH|nr:thioredoxin domain-containing protein [Candidatus Filomicrobium marinum]CFX09730.1 conserved protein of unknown function [Candidatus Filomicrobium marinum]CPR17006.1 conserved protein of unknown function [Candidatus Filomicrobium marinum]
MSRNRLADETSPYLLQHKDNPVHWWAWGPEALAEAKATGKPILLSVGYAACHWCHVMAHESFEDDETAAVMNELFVNIKLDREERPDIDAIYMSALHHLGEQGGWPLTMFLDTNARPFFGGTYFPKTRGYGRPAFVDVLHNISRIYHQEPEKVTHNADIITNALRAPPAQGQAMIVGDQLINELTSRLVGAVDPLNGGLTGAPKFPQWSIFWLLWRGAIRYGNETAAKAVENTLVHICQGGIYDHLGGGFSRYSVDERWLAPHFEKMLYDNALLVDELTECFRETGRPLFKRRIEETITWLQREMIAEGGGFAASLDADSEGEEGKFYVWSADEIQSVLGPEDAAVFCATYDVSCDGNWEGHNILNRLKRLDDLSDDEEARLAAMREKLLAHRVGRIRPGWDDKVLADWNGLMIAALARAAQVFARPDWLTTAETAFEFISTKMAPDGRLRHSYRDGKLGATATASDYANMVWGALRLFQATNAPKYLEAAQTWTDTLHQHYWLPAESRYATTADDTDDVLVRLSGGTDDAMPNANGIQVSNLMHLSMLTGDDRYREQAAMILESFSTDMHQNLVGHTGLLAAALDVINPQQVVIAAETPDGPMAKALHSVSLPGALEHIINDVEPTSRSPSVMGKAARDRQPTAYACIGPQCSAPLTDPEEFLGLLKQQRAAVG